jgi:acyl-CoA synthetase (AMP-forming)/AMP-acid ligase II
MLDWMPVPCVAVEALEAFAKTDIKPDATTSAIGLAGAAGLDDLASRPIAVRDGRPILRPQFMRDVTGWQAAFEHHPGTRFALSFEDAYDFASALFGAWHAGKQVFLPGDIQPATRARLDPLVDAWAGDGADALKTAPIGAPAARRTLLHPQATHVVIYTSGTNGEPLAIAKRLDQLEAEVHALQAAFGAGLQATLPPTVHATVSHQHIYGLLFRILWPLAAGRPFAAERLVYHEQMAARLDGGPSVLVSSPAHLGRMAPTLDWQGARNGLQAVFSSGGPLAADAAQACADLLGQSPREVYGSSETGGIAWRQQALQGERWQALPGIEWRIAEGLLEVRSGHLESADWWRTADLAAPHPTGGFVLLGRADRIVKIEEKRVSLSAMEAALERSGQVAHARVFLLQTPAGPRLAVAAVPTPAGWVSLLAAGKRSFSESLRVLLLDVVERVALPRRWRYVRSLPVNPQGKSTEALLAGLFRPLKPAVQWLRRDAYEALASVAVTPDLAVFDGHFDQQKVLPGVAQLGWAIEMARGCFTLPERFLRAEALKFHRPVLPPVELELKLVHRPVSGDVSFQFASRSGLHASGRLVFGAA